MASILVGREYLGAKLQPGNGRDVTEQGRRGGVYGVGGGPPRRGGRRGGRGGGRRGKREIGNKCNHQIRTELYENT